MNRLDVPPAELRSVWRGFGGVPVLRGLDLALRAGEVHALVGKNGAGKSTAIAVLLGLLEAHGGEARVFGVPSGELGATELERIGYVSGGARLYGSSKLSELIAFEAGTRRRFDAGVAQRILDALGLSTRRRFGRLSTGERQQVALALAVAGRPELLVLDEPALGLDVSVRRDFLAALVETIGQEGSAALLSTHLLGEAQRIADRITLLHEGVAVIEGATLEELQQRLAMRFVRVAEGGPGLDVLPGVLARRDTSEGVEVLTLDWGTAEGIGLRQAGCVQLGETLVPSLEDLFLLLTADGAHSAFTGLWESSEVVA